jgi:hypothetical protein
MAHFGQGIESDASTFSRSIFGLAGIAEFFLRKVSKQADKNSVAWSVFF